MDSLRWLVVAAAMTLAACASYPSDRKQARLQQYQDAAGAEVKSFRYFQFDSWTPLDREHLVVWTRPREAWLLKVMPVCVDLDFTQSLALTSSINRVYAGFDKILVGKDQCRIASIRPIDVAKLKDLQREARRDIEAKNSDQPHQ